MFIILDSTEFFDAPLADSNSFKVLKEYIRRTRSHLVVPEVVIREVLNHAKERLDRIANQITSLKRDYQKLRAAGAPDLVVQQPDYGATVRAYEATLRRRVTDEFAGIVLGLPAASHEDVLTRALKREKPFLENKDGYRDTLIWLSIKGKIAAHPGQYIFITNNSKDFSEPDLLAELGALPEGSSLKFIRDINAFIDQYAKREVEALDALLEQLRRDRRLGEFNLEEELTNLDSDIVEALSHKLRLGSMFRNIEEPYWVQSYDKPREIDVTDVLRVQDDIMIELSAILPCTIEGYMTHWELAAADEESIHVTDWNWNEHYAEVEFSADVRAKLLLRLSEEHFEEDEEVVYSVESVEALEARTVD